MAGCRTCNFDMCRNCQSSSFVGLKCAKDHNLYKMTPAQSGYPSSARCDGCRASIARRSVMGHCSLCKYDLCLECVNKQQQQKTQEAEKVEDKDSGPDAKVAALTDALAKMETAHQELKTQLEQEAQWHETAVHERRALEEELAATESRATGAAGLIATLRSQNEAQAAEISRFQSVVVELRSESADDDALNAQLADTAARLTVAETQARQAQENVNTETAARRAAEASAAANLTANMELQASNRTLTSKVAELEEQVTGLNDKIAEYEALLDTVRASASAESQAAMEEAAAKIAALEAANADRIAALEQKAEAANISAIAAQEAATNAAAEKKAAEEAARQAHAQRQAAELAAADAKLASKQTAEALAQVEEGKKYRQAAVVIKDFMVGASDKKALVGVIGNKTRHELMLIKTEYEFGIEGHDLIKDLTKALSGNFQKLVLGLFGHDMHEADAALLFKAFKGIGTDENLTIEIMCNRSDEELSAIALAYETKYGQTLAARLKSECGGKLLKLFNTILAGRSDPDDEEKLNADVDALYKAGEGKLGTNDQVFIDILGSANQAYLDKLCQTYAAQKGNLMTEVIRKEFGGNMKKALTALVTPTAKFYANGLRTALKGLGTDDSTTIRFIVTTKERCLPEVRALYDAGNKKCLIDMLTSETSGVYKNLLVATVASHSE